MSNKEKSLSAVEDLAIAFEQLHDDVEFLSNRLLNAGQVGDAERDTGESADNLVAIAYGNASLLKQKLPHDKFDYGAVCRAYEKLPFHRKQLRVVIMAMESIYIHYEKILNQ